MFSINNNFLYFAYGSNMFTFRLNMNNFVTSQFVSIGRLDNYRLDFIRYSKFWGGPTATVVPTANAHVWGVIWHIDAKDFEKLNEQESFERKKYYSKYVTVHTPYMGIKNCHIYIQKRNPLPRGDKEEIPIEHWPSWTYKEVLIIGAMEHKLPEYYRQNLEKIKDNGEKGCFKMYSLLLRYEKEKPCTCKIYNKTEKHPQLDLRKIRKSGGK